MPSVPTESRLVSPNPATLPLRGAALACDARGGLARVVLEQRFANVHALPLHVTYKLPLPADAAVSGFRFRVGDRTIEGEIDRKGKARERFEDAIAKGHTAALLEEERSSLFTQEIGNVPPGAEVVCEITIDQKLRWLDEGQWEWRFPLAAAPRYLGACGRVADAAEVSLDVARTLPVRASLAMAVRDASVAGRSPESPSHPLSCQPEGAGYRVELGSGNAVPLDRDVVVRWSVAAMKVGATIDVAGPRDGRLADAHALVTVVPPAAEAHAAPVARDLTVLLDTSGSMGGAPLEQAKRVTLALLDGLTDADGFEIIEFSNSPRRFKRAPIAGTRENKRAAAEWVRKLQASGGTEMRSGILEALKPLRPGCPRQVVLVTDGQIGFEREIVAEILDLLPGDARLHTVGVGSGVNRSLTAPAARAGRGIEVIIGLGEDPERAVARLRSRTDAPIVVDVIVSGSALVETAPAKVPDLFAATPVIVAARVKPEGGELVLRGRTATGAWEERLQVPATPAGSGSDAVVALFGREAVEDAEMRLAGGASKRDTDARIEQLGLSYRIATRLTSWIAVDVKPSVDPREPARHERVPQALPYGMAIEGLGLREEREVEAYYARSMAVAPQMRAYSQAAPAGAPPAPARPRPAAEPPPPPEEEGASRGMGALLSRAKKA
ncbi:MAG TPA: VIT domain-containing protein, partial [Polyangiaceae bacterium]|nr:VIT domain-containing protein [Polyangiaceae bacterium]